MQTRKEREKGSGERGRGRDGAQAERIPFSPSQNKKSKGNLVQAEEIESYWALPIGSHLDVKRQAAKALSGLANPPQGEEASGTLNAQQQRDLPPSSPQQARGKLLPDSDHDTKTHTAYMRLHQTPRATRETPLSSLVLAQLTGEPVPRSGLLPPLSVVSRPSRARLLPTTLCSPGLLRMLLSTLLLPGHLGQFGPCCVSVTLRQSCCTPPCPLKGCFVFLASKGRKLFLQLNNTVWSLQ